MIGVHDYKTSAPKPRNPKPQQKPAWSAHREVRSVLIYLWFLVIFSLAWFGSLAGAIAIRSHSHGCDEQTYCGNLIWGSSWSLLPDIGGVTSLAQINPFEGMLVAEDRANTTKSFGLSFLLILAFQSMLTLGLHCAELLVDISRDEDVWRQTYTVKGYVPRSALAVALGSWKTVLLLLFKPLVHWLFGLGMTYYFGFGVFMRPPQLLYMSIAIVLLALLGTFLCFAKPKGPQPAAFGHVQTLVNLIDEWYEKVFWGHKGKGINGVCHAGTASSPLPKIMMVEEYAAG